MIETVGSSLAQNAAFRKSKKTHLRRYHNNECGRGEAKGCTVLITTHNNTDFLMSQIGGGDRSLWQELLGKIIGHGMALERMVELKSLHPSTF